MRIFIITMEDPLYTLPFIKEIIEVRKKDIVGIAVAEGDRLKIGEKRSKAVYVLSLLLIMGLIPFLKNSFATVVFKVRKKLSSFLPVIRDPGIYGYAKENDIPVYKVTSLNNKEIIDTLRGLNIDVIINQSQSIIKKDLLDIPNIGVINRHNALLPKNRGRLTPFWVLYKEEKETGVSIHFVDEGIDAGPVIVQKSYPIMPKDNFNTIVDKNYRIAPQAMLKALEKLEQGEKDYIENNDQLATYNAVPTFKEALKFRRKNIWGLFRG